MNIVNGLKEFRLVPVLELDDIDQARWLADILVEENLPIAEVTLRSPKALDVLEAMKRQQPSLLIGAGTVLTVEQAQLSQAKGADFLVSPGLNPWVVEKALKLNIPMIPGVNNPSHIEQAMSLGLSAIKFFPAEASGGANFLKAILAPYSSLSVMPTGGINESNLANYLNIPQVFACGGSWFVSKALIQADDRDGIRNLIRSAKKRIVELDA